MPAKYSYYNYEGSPCRIEALKGDHGAAEIYQPGVGFVAGPKMTILFQATPISKAECEAMIIAIARATHAGA
jgi:hypothetical protein